MTKIRRQALLLILTSVLAAGSARATAGATEPGPPGPLPTGRGADGVILLMRHALAPGGGDPPGFVAGDCSTQRNLSEAGRAQARRIGQALRQMEVPVTSVWHSQWCRTRDTAELAFPGQGRAEPLFNSFFEAPERERAFVSEATDRLRGWRGPGVLLIVTHQVNITALSGVWPASGELVALRFDAKGRLNVLARLTL